MPQFSKKSLDCLASANGNLQRLFEEVGKTYDCTIIFGHRGQEEQERAFLNGQSKKKWPDSKHNVLPSLAVDAAPYPIDWNNIKRFYHFAGFVLATAQSLGIKIRWGGDWDSDNDFSDQNFNDLVHFELVD